MNRRDAMLERLPPLYNIATGSLVHQLLSLVANHQAAYDEDMQRVQRSHWIDTVFDREDLAKLGALFDVPMMPWEPQHLYRTRLKATVAARLRGAVSRDVLEFVIVQILNGVLESLGVKYFDLTSGGSVFHTGPTDQQREPAFVEFVPLIKRSDQLVERRGLLRALDKVTLSNRGLHPVPLRAVIRGVAGGLCQVPVLVNLTNTMVLAYVGEIACGQELRVEVDRRGDITATLGERDVRDRVYTGTGFVAGEVFAPIVPDATPTPLLLDRGDNTIWFFPLAIFDQKSLGSAVLGMPSADLEHGRFGAKSATPSGGTLFDESLFEQKSAVSLDLWWIEDRPASFRFEIPAGVVVCEAGAEGDLHDQNERLFSLLQQTVDLLSAAGVEGRVEPRLLRETQGLRDRVRVLPPIMAQEDMRMVSRLSAISALFDTSATDGSRFG
jgi:hypothetical protein